MKYQTSKIFWTGVMLSSLVGCSNNSSPQASVSISIPALRALSVASAPGTVSEFDCVALNVTGPDIPKEQGLGLVSGMVAASTGGTLNIQVPVGRQRLFQVIGLDSASGACPSSVTRASLLSTSAFPAIAEVGNRVADIEGDTILTISGSYDSATAKDIRTGQLLAGGGGDPGGGDPGGDSGGGGGGGGVPPGTTYCAESEASHFGGGAGTAAYPYLISTVAHWNHIGTSGSLSSCHYKLTANIDFAGQTPVQIGLLLDFGGTIDGNNKTISNGFVPAKLTGGYEYAGLINVATSTALIKNLTIDNFDINKPNPGNQWAHLGILMSRALWVAGEQHVIVQNVTIKNSDIHYVPGGTSYTPYVGLIASRSNSYSFTGIKIENSTISGMGTKARVGAIIGSMENSTLSNSVVSGFTFTASGMTVGDDYLVGGLVGAANTAATIEDCLVKNSTLNSSTNAKKTSSAVGLGGAVGVLEGAMRRVGVVGGTLTAGSQVGGLVGAMSGGSSSSLEDSYADTTVTADLSAGGAIGSMNASNTPSAVARVYSTSVVTNAGTNNRNGFIGLANSTGRVESSYWHNEASRGGSTGGDDGSNDLVGKDETAMKTEASYLFWDFSDPSGTWMLNSGEYPKLRSLSNYY